MRAKRTALLAGCALPLATLAACGGSEGSGSVASTPPPPPAAVTSSASPAPAPATATNYDSAEYRRSNAATQAQALAAYNAGATGAGVLVGVIDSGVDAASSEFAGRISPLSADIAGTRGLQDGSGHGTAVADVLLGARNDNGIHGVAFNATLLALRTDTPGSCSSVAGGPDGCSHSDANIAAALDAAVAARARVVNISLGGTPADARLRGALDRATAAGIIIVIAAGNDGLTSPMAAQNPDVLAQVANDPIARGLIVIAGAADSNGTIADFSNRAGNGAANYVTAAGVRVRAIDNNGTAFLYSGTSFSAPVVAGAIALIAQAFPTLTPAQIVALLYRSADDRGATGVDAIYGNGEINLARAFGPIGALSLAGSAVPVTLGTNATLGGAMGDAAKGSLGSVVRDEFGRDFAVDLAPTVARTAPTRMLAAALSIRGRSLAAAGARTSLAVAVDDVASERPLMLASHEAGRARVLAGAMTLMISRTVRLGIGGGRGADTLFAQPTDRDAPAFLVSDRSLARAPVGAFALRWGTGRIAVTLAAESGDMELWQRDALAPSTDGLRRYGYAQLSGRLDGGTGPLALHIRLTRLDERATILGSRFSAALGGSGATSWFADMGVRVALGDDWRLGARLTRGWTRLAANSARDDSVLATKSRSASIARTGLWVGGDILALRYAEPLRVADGGLALRLTGSGTRLLSLAPTGTERDWEAVYTRPVGPGWLSANTYWRQQPGHYANAPDDLGAAVRYSFGF